MQQLLLFMIYAEILVSKLLGFETFANFLRVSVSENLVSEKGSVIVSKKIGLGKKSQFRFQKKVLVSVSEKYGLEKVSVSVSENLVSEKKKSK